jgi:tetratricopeptide (TPR) repeat protein
VLFLAQLVSLSSVTAGAQEKKTLSLQPKVAPPELQIADSRETIPDWLARWELARVLSYAKRYDESSGEYEKLLQEKPELSEAQVEWATVLFWNGKPSEALKKLEQVPPRKLPEKAQILMADLYARQKKYDRAESLYRDYLKSRPDDLRVRLRLAEVLSWEKRYEPSLREYEEILKVRPEDNQVRRKYGFVLMWMGRFDDAARELKKTLP